jgi:hypothetical protein
MSALIQAGGLAVTMPASHRNTQSLPDIPALVASVDSAASQGQEDSVLVLVAGNFPLEWVPSVEDLVHGEATPPGVLEHSLDGGEALHALQATGQAGLAAAGVSRLLVRLFERSWMTWANRIRYRDHMERLFRLCHCLQRLHNHIERCRRCYNQLRIQTRQCCCSHQRRYQ